MPWDPWAGLFGEQGGRPLNRAERRQQEKRWAQMTRQQKRTRARSRRIEKREE